MAVIIPAVIGLASLGYGIYSNEHAKAQAKKEEEKIKENNAKYPRPEYKIPETEYDSQRMLERLSSQGLSDQSKQIALQNNDRGLTAAIDAILKGGGSSNAINQAYDTSQQRVNQLALADDAQRLQNINALIAQNRRMSDFLDKSYQINQYAPYADSRAENAQLLAMANANKQRGQEQLAQGISSAVRGVGSAAGAYAQQQGINNIGATTQVPKYVTPTQNNAYNQSQYLYPWASSQSNISPDSMLALNMVLNNTQSYSSYLNNQDQTPYPWNG